VIHFLGIYLLNRPAIGEDNANNVTRILLANLTMPKNCFRSGLVISRFLSNNPQTFRRPARVNYGPQ
jgi:hypothetical protein